MKNELRIGNYVSTGFMNPSPGGLQKCFNQCEVKSIGIEKVIVTEKIGRKGLEKHNYENLKPIPLTEEWLLKFGFIFDGHIYQSSDRIRDLSNKDTGIKYTSYFFNTRLNRWMDTQTRVCVDYVHQLQNLYFALTNEELTFKP